MLNGGKGGGTFTGRNNGASGKKETYPRNRRKRRDRGMS